MGAHKDSTKWKAASHHGDIKTFGLELTNDSECGSKSSVPIAVHEFKHAVGRSRWLVQIIAA